MFLYNILVLHAFELSQSGMMLFLVREIYDPAIHLTNKEYHNKYGIPNSQVQSQIEIPQLYMMGMTGGTDVDQLEFSSTRRECL